MSERVAKVADWDEKQHYKKGRGSPPWIKLHRKILDSRRFQCLPLASKALAPQLWLLASENDGVVNIDPDELVFRLRWNRDEIIMGLKPLIDKGYLIVASDVLAGCEQEDGPETETEVDTEVESISSSFDDVEHDPSNENVLRGTIAEALKLYRNVARDVGLPRPQGSQRQRKLMTTRLKDHGLDGWRTVCTKIRGSPFLHGKSADKPWPGATLDWICKPANFEKIMDGNYDATGDNDGQASRYMGFLRRGEIPEENGDCAGGEPLHGLKLIENGR